MRHNVTYTSCILFLTLCFSSELYAEHKKLIGYFPFQASYRENISLAETSAGKYTHLIYHQSDLNLDGSLVPVDPFTDLVKAQKINLETVIKVTMAPSLG